jgi:hypothetical protein
MITAWDIYWITRLDSINTFLATIFFIPLGIGCLTLMFYPILKMDVFDGEENKFRKFNKVLFKILPIYILIVGTIFCIFPNTKEAVAIYLIPKIANNEQVQKLPDNAMKFLNGKLEEWINDMGPEKKK